MATEELVRALHIMEWDEGFYLLFTPDAKRGLVLRALVSIEGGLASTKGC